jgi:hypothetical protein
MQSATRYQAWAIATVLLACSGQRAEDPGFSSGAAGPTGGTPGTSGGTAQEGPNGFGGSNSTGSDAGRSSGECSKMDLVFVVDNSESMEEEQGSLKANFPKFINVIQNYKTKAGRELDFRIAVTSTDAANDKGRFRTVGGIARPWLERSDANIVSVFGERAAIGITGSFDEQPLETLKLSLTDRITDKSNGTFLREDALLAVVILTDEDVAGLGPDVKLGLPPVFIPAKEPAAYIADIDALKAGKRERWASAVIAGPAQPAPTCKAVEATKLEDFTAKTGKNAIFSSICDTDLSGALERAVETFSAACKDFSGPR